MKCRFPIGAATFAAAFAVMSVSRAQEADPAAETAAGEVVAAPAAKAEKVFFPLLRFDLAEGAKVEIMKPRAAQWVPAQEGRYYPLGSAVRVAAGDGAEQTSAKFSFGEKCVLALSGPAEFATEPVAIGGKTRTLVLKRGHAALDLPRTLGDGLFNVAAPHFSCSNLAGESTFDYTPSGDGDEAVVRCVTGSLALEGRHYKIARMGAANQIRIRTTADGLFTSMRGESGDCKVALDQGVAVEKNFETGETKDAPRSLEFVLSPKCAIKIFRAKAKASGRVVVSTMTFGPSGEMLNRCAFAEGVSSVNSGELVVKATADADKEKKAKDDDAEAGETEAVEAVPEGDSKPAESGDSGI